MMIVLFVSGLMRYCFAFSISTTSFHLISAFFVVLITSIHLTHHGRVLIKHFFKIFKSPLKLFITLIISAFIIISVLKNIGPAKWLMDYSYESRLKEVIFRPHHQVTFQNIEHKTKIHRQADGVNLLINCELEKIENCVIAIWAESRGNIIEPLYLSSSIAYSQSLEFKNTKINRRDLLPIFFDGYARMKDQLKDDGENVDGVSTATIMDSFNLDSLFESRLKQFTLMVEVNEIGDKNENFSNHENALITRMPYGVGVPSLLYQADIDLYEDKKYYLMERLGRSDLENGQIVIIYDTEGMTTALGLVEKILIKIIK